jgi:nicotinamidase-related amidase
MSASEIALLLIDIQKDFWIPLQKFNKFLEFPNKITYLLKEGRKKGFQIIHIKSVFQPDQSDWMLFYRPEGRGEIPCIKGSEGSNFTSFAYPKPFEKILIKQTFDAFANTNLEDYLKKNKIKSVLVAGLETSVCVLFTATSAYNRQLLPLVVEDACADIPKRHETAIQMYKDLCFKTITTEQMVKDFNSIINLIKKFRKN